MAARGCARRRERARFTDGRPPSGPRRPGIGRAVAAAVLGLGLACAWAMPAAAQQGEDAFANALTPLPNQNRAQRRVNRAIDDVCPELDAPRGSGTPVRQLQVVCTAMIVNAQGLLTGETDQELGLNLETQELLGVAQAISAEEVQVAPESQLTEVRDVQVGNLLGRLSALRAGVAGPGISVAGLSLEAGDAILSAENDGSLLLGTDDGTRRIGGEGDAVLVGQGGDLGGFAGGRLGLFATGTGRFGDKDGTTVAEGFDFYTAGITAGADYRLTDQAAVGAAIGYSRFDADFDQTIDSPSGQELESDNFLLSLFGTYYLDNGFFFDGIASVGYSDYESTRRVLVRNENPDIGFETIDPTADPGELFDQEARADFDAWQYGAAANAGYDTFVGPVRVTPRVQLEYLHADIDGFTEEGAGGLNFEVDDQDIDSLLLRPGIELAYPFSLDFGVISPFVRAEYVREFLGDEDGVRVRFAVDPTPGQDSLYTLPAEDEDRDYGAVGAGVTATLAGGLALFADYEAIVGLSDFNVHKVAAGLRKDF